MKRSISYSMLLIAVGVAAGTTAAGEFGDLQPPIADAGQSMVLFSGSVGTLDGTGSYDPDGTIVSYLWINLTGQPPQLAIVNHDQPIATFTAPWVADSRGWSIGLDVRDNDGFSSTDTVFVWVRNPDDDGDGIVHLSDNCLNVANAAQRDTDGDGFGNRCDTDLNNDCTVNATDLGLLKLAFFTTDENADFNGDGMVNTLDLSVMKGAFFLAPGPSGTTSCSE